MGGAPRGRDAEALARRFLEERGLRPLARNVRSRHGEIDLVMADGDCIVFVEVRHRRRADFGDGAESVDARKQARITACAQHYLQRHPAVAGRPCRFDVVAILGALERPRIDWITDAFPAC